MTLILDEHHIAAAGQGTEPPGASVARAGPGEWAAGESLRERAGAAPELLVAATASAALWLLVGVAVWRRLSRRHGALSPRL